MKQTFIRTKNVKQFVGLMEEMQKLLPPNIPKLWRTWARKISNNSMAGR